MEEKPKGRGGRRSNQTGRPRVAEKARAFPFLMPADLYARYNALSKTQRAAVRTQVLDALRAALPSESTQPE